MEKVFQEAVGVEFDDEETRTAEAALQAYYIRHATCTLLPARPDCSTRSLCWTTFLYPIAWTTFSIPSNCHDSGQVVLPH